MLKRVFVAPDPGRLRLRAATRAVIGVGVAVTLCALTGYSLPAVITGGLAALLALFTVVDPTVRRQAVTTALLPVVGLPVLASAALLHDAALPSAAAFVFVAAAGVYARRWGARGHALGVFAFMTYFVTQFLDTVPADLPELYSTVLLSLLAASVVRFGLWCYERRIAVPALPSPLEGRGLARTTTRQAVQVAAAGSFALAAGQMISQERWYWAVGAAWWIFVNTSSRGETLVRGFRRVLGTVVGIGLGLLVAVPLGGAVGPTAALVAVCVFLIFYTAPVSYSWMMLAVTLMVALLYGLLGALEPGMLALRLAETGVGALGAALAVALVLPVTTHATTNAWIHRALLCMKRCTADAARRLAGDAEADPAPGVAELEALLARARLSLAPLLHPLSPRRARKARARQILALLDDCATEVRALARIAADPDASHDARLMAACWRVEAAVEELVREGASGAADTRAERTPAPAAHPGAERALAHLHSLESALADLRAPLRSAPDEPLGDGGAAPLSRV
ncbi:FUSC family protein [Streptomyces alkaliterrae]|uniref:FUSC family protein n=1 Tax=Streptomyces alkaliterrae TaxID=2213162 RepID=A0A5P0YNT6_9ACTN|nr:FUSC family protein [Streptomyces alkaliterrae]MBB1258851.1 FUSC family protein [Streptomyces alkaliterrae]MQS01082.1 FUSC family protein [Streptomyces alkaliterrae]